MVESLMEKTKLRKTYNILIRLTIILLTIFFIYDQLFYRKDFETILDFFPQVWGSKKFTLNFIFAVLLLPLNQVFEIIKWKFLIDKLEKVTYWSATKAVLTGISVSMFMPNRVGDYLGRVFVLKTADRLQAVLVTIIGSLAQLLTTILFGLLAVLFFYPSFWDMSEQLNIWMYSGLVVIALVMASAMVVAYLNFSFFSDVIKRISGRGYRRIKKYAKVFSWYHPKDLIKVLGLSMVRYLVFSFQFYLLLRAFDVNISYANAMMLIGLVYLLMTFIPTIALTELGVRGSVSLYIFSLFLTPLGLWSERAGLGVASATTLLWLINLAFPALLGVFFTYSLRFFRKLNGNGN